MSILIRNRALPKKNKKTHPNLKIYEFKNKYSNETTYISLGNPYRNHKFNDDDKEEFVIENLKDADQKIIPANQDIYLYVPMNQQKIGEIEKDKTLKIIEKLKGDKKSHTADVDYILPFHFTSAKTLEDICVLISKTFINLLEKNKTVNPHMFRVDINDISGKEIANEFVMDVVYVEKQNHIYHIWFDFDH